MKTETRTELKNGAPYSYLVIYKELPNGFGEMPYRRDTGKVDWAWLTDDELQRLSAYGEWRTANEELFARHVESEEQRLLKYGTHQRASYQTQFNERYLRERRDRRTGADDVYDYAAIVRAANAPRR